MASRLTLPRERSTPRTRSSEIGRIGVAAWQVGILVALLTLWEWGPVDGSVLSHPSAILARLWEDLSSGRVLVHLGATLQAVVFGYLAGVATGLVTAYALHLAPTVRTVLQPYLVALQGLPKVAIAPLFIIAFGIGIESKIVIAASLVFFLIFFNTLLGLSMVDSEYLNIARVMGASRWQLAVRVQWPSVLPYILSGLRVSLPYAVIGTVIGEYIATQYGIGAVILTATTQFDSAGTFAGVILLLLIVVVGNGLLGLLERRATPWSRPERPHATSPL